MRIVTLLFASLTLLVSVAATAEVDIEPGEYVVFYHHDVLGSPVTATNEQGQVIWHERTESYGKSEGRVSHNGNPFGDNALPAGNSRQGYTGHTLDNSAGLTYMKARYYDHNIGRFLSNDPVGFTPDKPMMFNRYLYAYNNPYSYWDPNGENAYLVSRPVGGASIASHNYIVYDASSIGDPNATVRSFGNNGADILDEVDNTTTGMSRTTAATDQAHWQSLANDAKKAAKNTTLLGTSPAHDEVAASYADGFVADKKYKLAPILDGGANSNTAAQAIAENVAQNKVNPPGGRLTTGLNKTDTINFNLHRKVPGDQHAR